MQLFSINSSRAVADTDGQSGSFSQAADVDYNLSDVVSENEIDADDDVLSTVALDQEARVLLRKYMGDLFEAGRGEPMMKVFFSPKPQSDPGIALPPELANAISSFDCEDKFLPMHDDTDKAFRFHSEDDIKYFLPKRLAPHTLAFANSLGNVKVNPLATREYKTADRKWSFVETAASTG